MEDTSMRTPTPIHLSDDQRRTLEQWTRKATGQQRYGLRARMILLLADGQSNQAIGKKLDIRPATVSKWRIRFAAQGLEGLLDAPRSGKPARYGPQTDQRVLDLLDTPPPSGYAQWNGTLLSKALGDVSSRQVWRILTRHQICLQRRRSFCISTDPEFAAKAADVVGLYLNPPENAVVLCVDEKPQIQALERAQGWLRLPNGRALSGFSHDYKRHGTTTLFAAPQIATGLVATGHYKRQRRREFLDFMNTLLAHYGPEQQIHVILDNRNTHKPKEDRWLKRHKNVHFHFTPTYSSWLNQVETWFSILSRSALLPASFTSPGQVRQAIDRFVEAYNPQAAPFEWTKTTVVAGTLKQSYADLCH